MAQHLTKNQAMDPQISQFLYINGAVLVALVAYMYFWRPRKRAIRLKLGESERKGKLDAMRGKRTRNTNLSEDSMTEDSAVRHAKELNVIFQFNGHDFDAYTVLGIPAGSSRDKVDRAYNELIRKLDPTSHEFYRLAYRAITVKDFR